MRLRSRVVTCRIGSMPSAATNAAAAKAAIDTRSRLSLIAQGVDLARAALGHLAQRRRIRAPRRRNLGHQQRLPGCYAFLQARGWFAHQSPTLPREAGFRPGADPLHGAADELFELFGLIVGRTVDQFGPLRFKSDLHQQTLDGADADFGPVVALCKWHSPLGQATTQMPRPPPSNA